LKGIKMAVTSVIMKIYEFDSEISAFLVAFNSNSSTKNIDDQPRFSYRLAMFDTNDVDTIIKHIARSGVSVAEAQDREEQIKQDSIAVDAYQSKVGEVLTFDVATLYSQLDAVQTSTDSQPTETITV
jgi:benzoyl-CoA reductase/2-hydroxyglutaryl-CoA dehydratase subunit BcrC/BadD/HgdB